MLDFPRKTQKQGMKCKRGKEKAPVKEENINTLRKIITVYTDPDATDSSSEEDDKFFSNGYPLNGCSKWVVKEISLPCMPSNLHEENSSQEDAKGEKIKASLGPFASRRNRKPSSMYKGVPQIKDPIRGIRIWLGTFDTEEEAAMAYERKKNEFDRKKKYCFIHLHHQCLITTKAPLDVNDLNGSVKEKVNVETNGEDGGIDVEPVYSEDNSILHLLEEPVVPSLVGHDGFYLDEIEKEAMLLGNDFYNFLDNDMEGGSVWNVEHGEGITLPPVDSAFNELTWIVETLNWECS
uniref:AP2/ERF domain-containing protein n=1 Tax=Glycine max TaxID=3847 RepID=A0A0R0IJ64_SOYBN